MEQEYEYTQDTIEEAKRLAESASQEVMDVSKYFLDFSAPIPRPNPVIYDPTNPNRIIVSESNIFAIIGEAKSYKSYLASLLVIDYLTQQPNEDVLLIDTEQAEWNVQHVAQRVCDGIGWGYKETYDSGKVRIANLRPYSKKERLRIVEAIIAQYHTKLIMVDGIRDLVTSVNEEEECSAVVDKFLAWSADYKCAIGTILHTNKDGETARGHLGFELLAKCETILLSKKRENGGASVKCVDSRNISIESFDFEIDPDKYFPKRVTRQLTEVEKIKVGTDRESKALTNMRHLENATEQEWINEIRKAGDMCAEATAKKWFNDFLTLGFVLPSNKEETHFSHKEHISRTPQEDTQTTIDNNSLGDSTDDLPF